ncbi:raffinose/stachyose/melibiose transport system substrate-binding protein [Cohnella sp. OV330]|uniref:ABC transporter substrate-binding protein n=1 Tax=Cohnella sp. OV330 TaxID=1855288 RepID=UPI0008E95271|nr:extracellular solute-binding protein [Cohnella sp. OV330]SFB04104.1 raffinose/stachyose/melibiose transport system substrate-binding protein [Cohnella sp. OV330]
MKKALALGMTGLMLSTALAACGSGNKENQASESAPASQPASQAAGSASAGAPAEKTKLRVYAQYSDDDTKGYYDYAVKELAKEMPNVELELEIQAQDDGQKLKTYAATGNLPDIFNTGLDQINVFRKSNNILQLDEYVDKFGFKDKMQPSTLNTLYTDDQHVYAFPYAGNEFMLIFYNKELFQQNGLEVPKTFDDLKKAVDTFKGKGITPMSIFAKEKWPDVGFYDMFATRYNTGGISALDKGTAKITDPGYKEAAQNIIDLVKAGLLAKGSTNMNYDQAAALFHEGKAAMFINGQWEIEASTKALGDKAGYMYYPASDAATYEKNKFAFSGGGTPGGFAVSANTKNKDLAAEVASLLALKYAEFKYTEKGSPIVSTKVDKPVVKAFDPMMETLAKDIPNITSTTAFAWGLSNAKFKAAIEDASQNLLSGSSYTADQFIEDVAAGLK